MNILNAKHKKNISKAIFVLLFFLCSCAIPQSAVNVNPDYTQTHYNLGLAYYEKGFYDQAVEEFKEVVRINPTLAEAHYMIGSAYFSLNRRGEALEEYNILKNLDKNLADKLFNYIYK